MNCSKKNLLDRIQQGASVEYLFFWEHQPSPNGKVTASCLTHNGGLVNLQLKASGMFVPNSSRWRRKPAVFMMNSRSTGFSRKTILLQSRNWGVRSEISVLLHFV